MSYPLPCLAPAADSAGGQGLILITQGWGWSLSLGDSSRTVPHRGCIAAFRGRSHAGGLKVEGSVGLRPSHTAFLLNWDLREACRMECAVSPWVIPPAPPQLSLPRKPRTRERKWPTWQERLPFQCSSSGQGGGIRRRMGASAGVTWGHVLPGLPAQMAKHCGQQHPLPSCAGGGEKKTQ